MRLGSMWKQIELLLGWPPPRVSTSAHHGAIIGWSATGKGAGVYVRAPPLKVMLPLVLR